MSSLFFFLTFNYFSSVTYKKILKLLSILLFTQWDNQTHINYLFLRKKNEEKSQ